MLKILASLIKPRKSQITQSTALQRKRTNEVMYDLLEKWNYYYRKRWTNLKNWKNQIITKF